MLYSATQIREASSHDNAAEMIRDNMQADNQWLFRGILAIYARQTHDEQASETTKYHNKRGFGALDADILSSFAKQIQTWMGTPVQARRYQCPLSPKQLQIARKNMAKYAGQLARIVREPQPQPVTA